jgi:tetratricopeptide (TPR) repeat protein
VEVGCSLIKYPPFIFILHESGDKMGFRSTMIICLWLRLLLFFQSEFSMVSTILASDTATANSDKSGQPSVGKLRSSADTLYTNGKFDESIDLWNKVIQLEPNNDSNFYKRFRVFLRQQKYKEAIFDLNSVLSLNPNHENALVQRAKLHMKLGKCQDSILDLEKLKK